MDDRTIAATNGKLLNRPNPTDVISCAYDPVPGGPAERTADVLLNVQRAVEEGARRGRSRRGKPLPWSPAHELALYLAHGLDHLAGHSDADPAGRRKMRRRELRWVRAAERDGLLIGLMG